MTHSLKLLERLALWTISQTRMCPDAQAVVVEGAEIVLEAPQPLALLLFSRRTSAFFKE